MTPPLLLFLFFFLLVAATQSVIFTCNSAPGTKCQSLAGYFSANATKISTLQTLFQVPSLRSLLAANDLPLSTPSTHLLPPNSTLRIPFPCSCSNSTGRSDHTPIYTVTPADPGLDAIARYTFLQFVTYQEIAAANNISNANIITVGQRLWIPLPCSCDSVGGEAKVHLGHVVAVGSDLEGIAAEFGTEKEVLMQLNGISDPKKLQAGQVLDVPLKACSSSISNKSLDHDLLLPNGSYALTAENCIQCSCSSSNKYQLSCHPVQSYHSSVCPVTKCGDLYIGNSTTSGCDQTTCTYQGYTNSTSLKILSSLTTQSTCNVGSPVPQPAGSLQPGGNSPPNSAGRLGLHTYWIEFLVLLQMAFFCLGF